jgi:3'-phosphoadenosine 5'-phosphosulfate sulfotransferase (PAPS reductase)/FAD synthetase
MWPELTVLWCNTGSAYPETLNLVAEVSSLVPHFVEVRSDKDAWASVFGFGVDVLPERNSMLGALIHGAKGPLYNSYLRCCSANIWEPMEQKSRELGATLIIRGQRADEGAKAPIKSGFVDKFGVRYEFPIEDWTKEEVLDYCKQVCPELLPKYYLEGETTSHDCWDCIAYLGENIPRIMALCPTKRKVVMDRIKVYSDVIRKELAPLEDLQNVVK